MIFEIIVGVFLGKILYSVFTGIIKGVFSAFAEKYKRKEVFNNEKNV